MTIAISVLGTPEIQASGKPLALPTRKALALLIYLAVEQKPYSRDHLMALFWPDSDLQRAQTSLRTSMSYIRRALPQSLLVSDRETVCFNRDAGIVLDSDILLAAAKRASRPQMKQSVLLTVFQDAVQRVRGDFLAGFSIGDVPDFDDWVSLQREFFHQQFVLVFDSLSRLQLDMGYGFEGLSTTSRWIDLSPYNEAAYQRQMQLYLATGNRIAALQTYKRLTLMLSNEFGVAPSTYSGALEEQAQALTDHNQRLQDPEAECIALNRMAMSISQSSYDLNRALDLLRQALHLAHQLENPLHRAETYWNLAQTYFYLGSIERALQYGETALAAARQIGRDDLIGRVLNTIAYARLWSGAPHAEIASGLDEALAIFERLRQPRLQVDCMTVKANSLLSKGYSEPGFQLAEAAMAISADIQDDWGIASSSYNLGLALIDRRDFKGAEEACLKGIEHARTAGHPPLVFFNLIVLGHVYRDEGTPERALTTHLEAQSLANSLHSPYFDLLVNTELCADYGVLSQHERAVEYALRARSVRLRAPYSDYTRCHEISALLIGGLLDAVREELEFMEQQLRVDPDNRRLQYFFQRSAGSWADANGDRLTAQLHVTQASQLAQQYGLLAELSATRDVLSRLNTGVVKD